ncbi:MAG: SusC/RagA family TonB-linked outer membrane protein [Flavobacteriaceae bacterium]|jgi:TonB-linked SusC/RagA family outer membrane protein|nr:SusC/RagA family TonB-linked outer membrane protein [Flavobacteriaceae bacterium]
MRKKIITSFLVFITSTFSLLFAQTLTVSGKVSDVDGNALPGVNIQVKGTSTGASTDFDGNYQIIANQGDVLIFSFIGFATKEIPITSQTLNVLLEESTNELNEVVVTALGIKKEKKALGYSVQSINSDELLEGNQNNMINSLQGKVSGVTVVNSGGAPGASTVILIRGGTSITGNNQPLIIVDGIPIDNSTNSSLEVASANRASDINPEDIENISVLKGPAAAALYGLEAANGAVVITTKKGKSGAGKITYSGSLSVNDVLGTPDIQTRYGQGEQLVSSSGTTINPESQLSWGNEISAGTQIYNNIEDFYKTAVTQNHNVSYSGGNEKSNFYFSIGDLSQGGLIEDTNYDKTSFKINVNSEIKKNLTLGVSANYITTNVESTKQGNASGASFSSLLSYPVNVNAMDYLNDDGSQKAFFTGQEFDNPYWSNKFSPNTDDVRRLIGVASLSYDFLNHFNLTYRAGVDSYNQFVKRVTGNGSLIDNRNDGYISQFDKDYKKLTSNLFLTFQKDLTEDISLEMMVGNSVEETDVRYEYASGRDFLAPGIYSISNISLEKQSITEVISRKRIVGVFGDLKLGWKDALYLTATARNDWSSTLPENNRSFFYPSVGVSAILTELFENMKSDGNGLNYLKFRATWAKVGKDVPRTGMLESYLSTNINGLASSAYTWNGVNVGNPALEPEFTNSFETGFDARFFNNRIGLNASYYYSKSDNQILVDMRVPPTTGTFYATLNGGYIENSGIEIMLDTKVIQKTDWSWDLTFNFGINKSNVEDLPGTIKEAYMSDSWTFLNSAAGAAILDGSLFGLRGKRPTRDANGQILINSNGLPSLTDEIYTNVDRQPDYTLGITSMFNYKNLSLSFLLDIVQGFDAYNATSSALVYYGLSPITLDRGTTTVINGVDRTTGSPNTIEVVKNQDYYQDYYALNSENFIEDGSFARLRYVTLAYKFPKELTNKFSLSNFEIYATARNLFTITDYSGVDPEVNTFGAGISGAGSVAIDNLGTPNTKGFDFGLKFSF